jgi:ABC-type sugar transport system substrate-binding protein
VSGLSVLLSASHRDLEQEIAAIDTFHRRRVDGILVTDSRISKQHTKQLTQIAVPTVLINGQIEDQCEIFHSVAIDDRLGARLATGGSGVLGGAMARGLALAGARVVVLGRNEALAEAVIAEITANAGESMAVLAGVSDRSQLEIARDKTIQRWGQIDKVMVEKKTAARLYCQSIYLLCLPSERLVE